MTDIFAPKLTWLTEPININSIFNQKSGFIPTLNWKTTKFQTFPKGETGMKGHSIMRRKF